MYVYMYQADLWCDDCGEKIREELDKKGLAPDDPDNEGSYDSDQYPKGPYPDGGGEADTPMHCAAGEDCANAVKLDTGDKVGALLENELTAEGIEYVKHAAVDAFLCMSPKKHCEHQRAVTSLWLDAYSYDVGVTANDLEEWLDAGREWAESLLAEYRGRLPEKLPPHDLTAVTEEAGLDLDEYGIEVFLTGAKITWAEAVKKEKRTQSTLPFRKR